MIVENRTSQASKFGISAVIVSPPATSPPEPPVRHDPQHDDRDDWTDDDWIMAGIA